MVCLRFAAEILLDLSFRSLLLLPGCMPVVLKGACCCSRVQAGQCMGVCIS